MLSFTDEEDEIINSVLSVLNIGTRTRILDETQFLSKFKYNDLEVSLEKREVKKCGQLIDMTFTEFEILQLLIQNPGIVFSKEQIYNIVWKEPSVGDYSIVANHVRHIRKKIEDDSTRPIYIQTVWGVGYRFNPKISSG